MNSREKALRVQEGLQEVGDRWPSLTRILDTEGTPRYTVSAKSTSFDTGEVLLMLTLAQEEDVALDFNATDGRIEARFQDWYERARPEALLALSDFRVACELALKALRGELSPAVAEHACEQALKKVERFEKKGPSQ